MSLFEKPLAIIDTETTGMRAGFARVIDIGIIRVEEGKVVEQFETLLNPGTSIPSALTAIHGISDYHVASAPTFDEVALEIERLLDGAIFVAHNAAFDYGFIKAEFARIGMSFSSETLCTVKLSRSLFPSERRHNLDAIIERHAIACKNRHRAFPDAEVVWQFLRSLEQTIKPAELKRATTSVLRGAASALGKDSFTALPDTAGVYKFYGPEQELLYIGKSKRLRTRARSHFNPRAAKSDRAISKETSSIESIPTSGELSALILESALVKKEGPLYNRQLRRKHALFIGKKQAVGGYDTLVIERADEIAADGSVLAVFRSAAQAKQVVRSLAVEHALCERLLGVEPGHGPCFKSQLGACDGACRGVLPVEAHNERLATAFESRRVRAWPYRGPVIIRERESESKGTAFFLDQWILYGAYTYEDEMFQPLVEIDARFEYDTYKILTRFLRKKNHTADVQTVSSEEFAQALARVRGET